ncbi:hypothetical protein BAE46_00700 [Glaciecola punicea]|uniref:hypothetical protein n=1 Tax=Glaciecola punicea TaxID=56804 RepID=UPI00087248E2|nr:hypothetical protein [Glaciecola punicea]OFA33263.1 hypothetical protein BAE46_00700 [Glaciecola punicea]
MKIVLEEKDLKAAITQYLQGSNILPNTTSVTAVDFETEGLSVEATATIETNQSNATSYQESKSSPVKRTRRSKAQIESDEAEEAKELAAEEAHETGLKTTEPEPEAVDDSPAEQEEEEDTDEEEVKPVAKDKKSLFA